MQTTDDDDSPRHLISDRELDLLAWAEDAFLDRARAEQLAAAVNDDGALVLAPMLAAR